MYGVRRAAVLLTLRKWPPISQTKVDVRPWSNQHRSWGNRISATTSWGLIAVCRHPFVATIPHEGTSFLSRAPSWGTLIINHLPRSDMGSHGRTTTRQHFLGTDPLVYTAGCPVIMDGASGVHHEAQPNVACAFSDISTNNGC